MISRSISQRARSSGGQPVSYLMHKALAHPELISLAAGFVDQQTLPVEAMREAVEAVLSNPFRARAALQYGVTPGYRPLREAIMANWLTVEGLPTDQLSEMVERVVLTAGSNQMLHLLADALFDPGDIVFCAAPTYFVYLGLLANLGVRGVGVASDEQGLIPEALDEAFRRVEHAGELHRVKAIYVVSYFDNPSAANLARERRPQIVELAQRWSHSGRIHVIEDAAYRSLRYDGPGLPSLASFDVDGRTVIHTQTFSKSFSPGLRVGWALLPPQLVTPVCDLKGNADFGSPHFNQHVLAEVLERRLLEPHVDLLRASYRTKRDSMLSALDEHLADVPGCHWARPDGGLYVWLHVPPMIETGPSGQLFDRAVAEGMLYVPGEYCFAAEGEPTPRNMIRLSFGVQPPDRIKQGIAALARAIRACGVGGCVDPDKSGTGTGCA